MSVAFSERPSTAAFRSPRPPRQPHRGWNPAPYLVGALVGAVAALAFAGRPSAGALPELSIGESTRRIGTNMLDAEAYAARGRAYAAKAAAEADPTESLIRAIEDFERALGVGGEEWRHRELVETLQDAARFRLGLAVSPGDR